MIERQLIKAAFLAERAVLAGLRDRRTFKSTNCLRSRAELPDRDPAFWRSTFPKPPRWSRCTGWTDA
jgi:hypothetical protein